MNKPQSQQIAPGVHRVTGGPGRCNVYLIEDDGGVTMFDAGVRTMIAQVAQVAARFGGIKRIVLGHGHTDHRGTAPYLNAPVYCHSEEVVDAEGSGGFRYWGVGLPKVPFGERQFHGYMHRRYWDGGPVTTAGTVAEGDEIAGFTVIWLPGHAPGQIALYRESDGVALTTDIFYTLDRVARDCPPHVPYHPYNFDTEQAIASIRRLAEIGPAICWPGHAEPLNSDVRAALTRAADAG